MSHGMCGGLMRGDKVAQVKQELPARQAGGFVGKARFVTLF